MKNKKICATDLSTYIVIEQPSDEDDGMGGKKAGWDQIMEAWALIEPGKGKERIVAQRVESQVFHAVFIRMALDVKIDNSMRVRYRDAYGTAVFYNIRAVVDLDMKHEFLELTCEEGVGTWP